MAQGDNSELHTLYETLKRDNYDVPDSYDSFERTLSATDNDGIRSRKALYETLKRDNYDVPDSYDSFERTLFAPASPDMAGGVAAGMAGVGMGKREKPGTGAGVVGEDSPTLEVVDENRLDELYGAWRDVAGVTDMDYDVFARKMADDSTGRDIYRRLEAAGYVMPGYDKVRSDIFGGKGSAVRDAAGAVKAGETAVGMAGGGRFTDEQREAMSRSVDAVMQGYERGNDIMRQETARMVDYASQAGVGRYGQTVDVGGGVKVSGGYMVPTGDVVEDKRLADALSQSFRVTADMSAGGKLRRARLRLQELESRLDARSKANMRKFVDQGKMPLLVSGFDGEYGQSVNESDDVYRALSVAVNQTREQIKNLEEQHDRDRGEDVGFWRGFGRTVTDIRNWDTGRGDALDAMLMLNADNYSAPNATEEEKRAGREMMRSIYEREETEREYGGNASFWYKAGVTSGYMPTFIKDFALTGGGYGMVNVAGKGATRLATKVIGKEAVKEIGKLGVKEYAKKYGVRGVGRMAGNWTIKALGTTMDDMLIRAPLMTNTIQAGTTLADVIDRKLGDVRIDENGNYDFSNDQTWGSAVWQAEANSIIENASEMAGEKLGEILPGMAKVFGGNRISGMLARAKASNYGQIYGATSKWLNKMGVSDYFGEVSEEYYGHMWRTLLNLDDAYMEIPVLDAEGRQVIGGDGKPMYERKNVAEDLEFHTDLWGGMALSMGMMAGGKHGWSAGRYAWCKHRVNVADKRASVLFGADGWEVIRSVIDNTDNEGMGKLAQEIGRSGGLTPEEFDAAMTYMEHLMNMRGLNLADMAKGRGKEDGDEDGLNESFMNGYDAVREMEKVDAQNMYEYQRQRLVNELGGLGEEEISRILDEVDEDAVGALGRTYEPWLREVIRDYANAKAVRDGIIQRVNDDIEVRIAQSDAMIKGRVNRASGMIQPAVMDLDNRQVFVVDGRLAVNEDGTIDRAGSDESFVVRDAVTGELAFADPRSIVSVGEALEPEMVREMATEEIRQQAAQAAADAMNGTLAFNPGDVVQINDGGGVTDVTIVGPVVDEESGMPVEGQVIVQFADGQQRAFAKERLQAFADAANKERVSVFEQERMGPQEDKGRYRLNDVVTVVGAEGVEVRGDITGELDEDGTVEVTTDEPVNGRIVNRYRLEDLEGMVRTHNGEPVTKPEPTVESGSNNQSEVVPVGYGVFGEIYDVFKGRAKEAIAWLFAKKSGEAKGVFHREEIGDINLVWGNEKGGLQHIIDKHIIEYSDFGSIEEMKNWLKYVIEGGDIIVQKGGNLKIERDGHRVIVSKTENGDFVVTAYDNSRLQSEKKRSEADATLFRQRVLDEMNGTPVSSSLASDGKVSDSAEDKQVGTEESLGGALSRVPVDDKGKPMFEEADADTAWDAIVEKTADEKIAQSFADNMVANAEVALKKAEKAKTKASTDIDEFVEAENERLATLERAKAALDHWKKIAGTKQRRESERRAAEDAEARRLALERAEEEARQKAEREEAARLEREALNGVPDWAVDTPADARARGYRRNGPQKVDRPAIIDDHAIGNAVEVKFADGIMSRGNVAVIEASQLQPSHRDGQRNPSHFLDEAQPKERKDAASRVAAGKMANNIRPEEITSGVTAYTGAPSVNSRGEIIQGNNRGEALRIMYERNSESAARYKQYLMDHADDFGLTPEAIEGFEQPVLVNMLDVSDEDAITLGQYVAQDTESGGIERIKPKNAVQKMGNKIRTFANLLLRSSDDEATFAQLVDANGLEVLKWMNQQGFISNTQYASAFDSRGNLSAEAANDLKGIMYQSIFTGGSTRLEEMFDKLPVHAQRAILSTAYRDNDSAREDRMLPEIQQSIVVFTALMGYPQFREARNYEMAKKAVDSWSRQMAFDDVSGESYLPSETFSNFALALAAMYKCNTQRYMQSVFKNMFDIIQGKVEATLVSEANNTPRTLAEAIREVLGIDYKPIKINDENGQDGSTVLDDNSNAGETGRGRGDRDADGGEQTATGAEPPVGGRGTVLPVAERGGQGDIQHAQRPEQNNLSQTEAEGLDYKTSDELDENGRPFVLNSKGEIEFGRIDEKVQAEAGLTPAPILLSEGIITNPRTNEGYGLIHIEARHGAQIRANGYKSVIEFIEDVADKWHVINEAKDRNGNPTYRLIAHGKHNNTLMIELSGDGTYWNINTAGIFKTSYGKNAKELYNRHTTDKQSAETVEASQEPGQSGTTDSSRMNAPATSDDKVNDSASDKQGSGAESSTSTLGELIAAAEAEVNTDPTPAQKEAGNYKKGHVQVGTFDVTIEQPVGSVRRGTDADGKEWETTMHNTYGYIRGTQSVDGDHIDVFLSTDIDAWNGRSVVIVDQYNPDGSFDEHKVMLGFNDKADAINAYLANYENGWEKGRRLVFSSATLEDFEKWIESSHRKQKPYHKYKIADKAEVEESTPENPVFSIGNNAEGTPEVYEMTKGMLEGAGIEVVEVSDAEAQAMLNNGSGDERLMGSRTDRKMEKIGEHYAGKELDGNQQAVVEVFSGKADNLPVEVERGDGKRRIIMRQGDELKAGTKHSLFRHFGAKSNNIEVEDIAMVPEIIAKGERTVNGNKIAYDYVTEDGTRLRVMTKKTEGREEFTNFISNRKPPKSESRQAQEGNTQSSARATNPEVSDAKIGNNGESGKIKLLKTPQGTVYGWTVEGKVYLNRDAMNPETPLHEYTHLWDEMVRRENPELWARGKELMRQTPLWTEVENDPNYADIRGNEDEIASEVHSRLTGKDGAKLLQEMIDRSRGEGAMATAEAVTLVERIKGWLGEMFKNLKETLGRWSQRELEGLTLEDFNRMTLRDLVEGMNPQVEMRRGDKLRTVTEANPMLDDYHTGIRKREDVMTFDEMLKEAEASFEEYGDLTYPDMDIEMLREAKRSGMITIYSSKPIGAGAFVTPSRMNAEDYAGGGHVYSQQVAVDDVAWISDDEGQYAPRTEAGTNGMTRFHAAMSRGREEFDVVRERAVAERGIVMPGLNEVQVRVVDVPRHDFEGSKPIAQARKWAKENIVGEHILTDSSGVEVPYSISGRMIDKYLSASAINKSENVGVHLSVLTKLPAVIGKSIEAEVHPDYSKDRDGMRSPENGLNEDNLIHRFYGAVNMAGEVYRVKTTIIESKTEDKKKPHSFEVSNVELIEETAGQDGREGTDTHHPRYSETSSEKATSGNVATIPVANLLKGVEKSYEPGVKLLDVSEKSSIRAVSEEETEDDVVYRSGRVDDVISESDMAKLSPDNRKAVAEYVSDRPCASLGVISGIEDIDALDGLSEEGRSELKDIYGSNTALAVYCRENKKIYIFANREDYSRVPLILLHENVHAVIDKMGYDAEGFMQQVSGNGYRNGIFSRLIEVLRREYDAEDVAEEFMAYVLSSMADKPQMKAAVMDSLDGSTKLDVETILDEIYGTKENGAKFKEGKQRNVSGFERGDVRQNNISTERERGEIDNYGLDRENGTNGEVRGRDGGERGRGSEIVDRQGDGGGAYSDAEVSMAGDPVSKVMGRNRFSKQRQAEFAARERQRMADRIKELAERMHLDNVEVVTDTSQLEGKRAKAKGFYNKRTGKITIVIPNNISTIDAEQTLLHEAVAHYGLRKLFGEQFNTFLDNVYESADEEIRRRIAQMAAQNGWDFRTATEEYLAGLAEDTNFEEAQSYVGWWMNIKRLFLDMLESIGFAGFRDRTGVVLTDNELRYLLWRSYKNLTEPGRYRSILGEAEDVSRQIELKVGNYAEQGIEAEYAAEPSNTGIINERFDNELSEYENGTLPIGHRFELGMPSRYLRSAGFPKLPISMRSSLLASKSAMDRHPFEASDIKGLVEAIQKPIAIFEYTKPNMRNLIVDVTHGDKHFLVGVTLNYKAGDIEINSVSGLFPKDSIEWLKWIQNGKAIRIDQKEKVQEIIASQRTTNTVESERIGLNLDDVAKIVENFENPTIEEEELFRLGDFSPRDRAIARDTYNRICASGGYQFQEAVQDSMLGLKKLYQAILGEGTRIENVSGFENAYLFENRMSSMNAGEQHEYYLRYMEPLLKEIGRIAGANERKRRELTDYLMAKHGLERNEYMRKEAEARNAKLKPGKKPEKTDRDFAGLIGLTGEADWQSAEDTARQWVDDYEKMVDTTALWEAINKATKATLEKVYLSGIISKDTYEKILGMYDYYVPLRGWDETTSEQVYGYLTSKDGPLGGSIMKKAEGRESMADDPIATIGMMADDAIRQGNRNLMKQRFLNFILNHPSDAVSVHDLWLEYDAVTDEWRPVFADIKETDTPDEVARKVEAFEQRMKALRTAEPDKYKKGREAQHIPYKVVRGNLHEHQILIKRGGRTFVATINGNPRAAQAINGLTNPDVDQNGVVGNVLKGITRFNRQLSAFYTTRNPEFVVGNFFRDMLYSNCMTWVKESPRYALRFHKNFGKFAPISPRRTMRLRKGIRGGTVYSTGMLLRKWEAGTLDMSDKYEKMFYEFMINGGETGYTNVRDIEGHKRAVAAELKKQGSPGRKAWTALGMQLDLLNRSAENCARFAAFVTSREFGRSIDRAIYDAKEISVNFNKKGSGGKMINANGQTTLGEVGAFLGGGCRLLYVFWNAGVQGMTNFGRQAKRHPAKFTAAATTLFTLGYVISLLAQMLGGGDGDDDDKNAYYNLPEYVRRSNFCFYAGDQWITIPLPIEFRAFYGLGELAYSVISGNERYSDKELALQTAGQVSQIMPLDMLEGGGGINPIIPSAFKPATEAYIMNKGWTGLPVYKDTPFNKNDPEWTKAYASTDKHLVDFARWLNETTGGDDFKKGAIDINPARIEYMLNGTFGGLVTFPNKLKKTGETFIWDNREFEWKNMPIASRLIKSGDERTANRKLQNEYFKYEAEYDETGRLMRKYANAADNGILGYAKKVDFMENSPEYLRHEIFDDYKAAIDAYKQELSEETDKKKRAVLEAERYAVMRELVNALHDPKTYFKNLYKAGQLSEEYIEYLKTHHGIVLGEEQE